VASRREAVETRSRRSRPHNYCGRQGLLDEHARQLSSRQPLPSCDAYCVNQEVHGVAEEIQMMSKGSGQQFTHRGVVAVRSTNSVGVVRWLAEVARGRHFQFLRAATAAEIKQRIDVALESWPMER